MIHVRTFNDKSQFWTLEKEQIIFIIIIAIYIILSTITNIRMYMYTEQYSLYSTIHNYYLLLVLLLM